MVTILGDEKEIQEEKSERRTNESVALICCTLPAVQEVADEYDYFEKNLSFAEGFLWSAFDLPTSDQYLSFLAIPSTGNPLTNV